MINQKHILFFLLFVLKKQKKRHFISEIATLLFPNNAAAGAFDKAPAAVMNVAIVFFCPCARCRFNATRARYL